MTGYLTLHGGEVILLPEILQWRFVYTDGDPCDSFSVCFCHEAALTERLRTAVGFRAVYGGKTVFTGVVDDYEVSLGEKGLLTELTGRGMAAVLLDNQVQAAEYQSAQIQDILNAYVRPYGIAEIEADAMGAVRKFVVETGYSCWQVLAGFCRHSENIFPRFKTDGTLVLRKNDSGAQMRLSREECVEAKILKSRYGRSSKQILVNTRTGAQSVSVDEEFAAEGGNCVKIHGVTGEKIRAAWRNAAQRVEDAARDKTLLEVKTVGAFCAWPLDKITVSIEEMGISGEYTVQTAESCCDTRGMLCTLRLR